MNPSLHIGELDFGSSIMGFETLRYFHLEKLEGNHPFFVLRSKKESRVEFVVISPFETYKDYEIEISDELKQELGIEVPQDVMVLCIVNVKKPFEQSTINLLAPLVINVTNGVSRQIILNGSGHQARAQLFPNRGQGG